MAEAKEVKKEEAKKEAVKENEGDEIAKVEEEGKSGDKPRAEGQLPGTENEDLLGKEEDMDKDEGGAEYRRKSIHAKPYASKTIEQTQKDVEGLIVKKTR